MNVLVPLCVAIPLVAAGALAALASFVHPRLGSIVAVCVSATVAVFAVILIFQSSHATIHYWFGGWHPRNGIAIGISFSVEPLGAGITALIGVLMTAALVQSIDYFEEKVPPHFFVLMLVFLAAMVGFALSSDLFNMFVFFELMSTAAFALTGYRIEHRSVLQGAINFAVVNGIGAFMLLAGIALVYGRTGALNLAQIGEVLSRRGADGLVVVAFGLIVVGLLTKAGAVPFHFWLSDAYAVAPAPVCVLFAGVMSDLGLHGIGRVYWEGFSGVLGHGHAGAVRGVLIGVGLLTALLGALMAFMQAAIKRMLAFVVISHVGIFLSAIGLLTARGLAGATVYVVADGLVKGALFCAVGYLALRVGHTDELIAHGRGRHLRLTGTIVAVGALGLAAVPPLGTFVSYALVDSAAAGVGYRWLPPVLAIATALTGAAVLRATARIFLGLGPAEDDLLVAAPRGEEEDEGGRERAAPRRGILLWGPALALLVAGLGLAFAPGIADHAVQHADRFVDRAAVARETLHEAPPQPLPRVHEHTGGGSYAYGASSAALAVALAWVGLYRRRIPRMVRRALELTAGPAVQRLKLLHDGVVGEYVTWLTVGAAAITGLLAVLTR